MPPPPKVAYVPGFIITNIINYSSVKKLGNIAMAGVNTTYMMFIKNG